MTKKNKTISFWTLVFLVALVLAGIYILISGYGTGVLVSCDTHQVFGIKSLPPPLMAAAQPEFCIVNVSVTSLNGTSICNAYGGIFNSEKGIIECDIPKKFKGEELIVTAKFFDLNKNYLGSDTKNVISNP